MPRPHDLLHLPDQLSFLLLVDRLKSVQRTTFLHDGSRPENSAEHSWHLAVMALTLAEYALPGTDLMRVVRMLLLHDLVEIHAGDLHFDATTEQHAAQAHAERDAARHLFGLLPAAQADEFHALWLEFEDRCTPEARFARALDALHPMLLTWGEGGKGCADRAPELTAARLLTLKEGALRDFPALWQLARDTLNRAVQDGTLAPQ